MPSNRMATLYILGDHGETVDGAANDVRGRQVKDKNGEGIGKVADLLVDDREHKVRFMIIEHGGFLGFGQTKSLIPVDAVTRITEDDVFVDQSRERVAAAPSYSPDLVNEEPHHASLYEHYGYPPYWGPGYMYPSNVAGLPMTSPEAWR